ncbi:MAG: glycoside hydrolase family 3 C-terminal domain-containing protein [Chloroflexi bacterium]|nr:glycoside hydrolase family 3 C-terminal domain-containing protein [Chloroflexota bacterium]MCC6892980.1 glycoside hydrolase family 3 C-terminal domain-containing protein [Anaerolineae bacterium]
MKTFFRSLIIFVLFLLALPVVAQDDVPPADAPYKNAGLPVEERVEDLLARMTLEEKIGQMTLVEKNSIKTEDIAGMALGGLLSGGGGYPRTNSAEAWAEMVDGFQQEALNTRLAIPIIYGVDAVHGHNNVKGAVIFPHNIGMGATRNAALVEQACAITAVETAATGIYWDYAPVVAVVQDIRWGRTYESYSENTEVVNELSTACVNGLQSDDLYVLATPKHYVGDGGAGWDTSTTDNYIIDRGVTQGDEAFLRAVHLPPYQAAIDAGAMSIMVSYSSFDGMKMSAQKYLITDLLKGEMGFTGFVVSDWKAIDEIPGDYYDDVVTSINAGMDMNMVPYDYPAFIDAMTDAVAAGDISMERVDDAVRRILRVKFVMGLFEHPFSNPDLLASVGSDEHREVARQAVSESLVLLKNENAALPLAKDVAHIFVAGEGADDIGIQSGGWTIEWQGKTGNITTGTTILDAIKEAVGEDVDVKFNRFGRYNNANDESGNPIQAEIGIVVIGEQPYAEGMGDDGDLSLSEPDLGMIARVRERVDKLIVILVSGRPMVINDALDEADAFVAAWLPGTEGAGVTDVLFGDKPFTGKLPFTWPRSVDQLPFDFTNLPTDGDDSPLFPFGYGLTTGE